MLFSFSVLLDLGSPVEKQKKYFLLAARTQTDKQTKRSQLVYFSAVVLHRKLCPKVTEEFLNRLNFQASTDILFAINFNYFLSILKKY